MKYFTTLGVLIMALTISTFMTSCGSKTDDIKTVSVSAGVVSEEFVSNSGVWYENGDVNGAYFAFNEDGSWRYFIKKSVKPEWKLTNAGKTVKSDKGDGWFSLLSDTQGQNYEMSVLSADSADIYIEGNKINMFLRLH